MKGKIAIEPTLTNVKEYLSNEGYIIESMSPSEGSLNNLKAYDAIVVTGLNTNLLGVQDSETKTVVINADGLTHPEVAKRLDEI